MVIGVLTSCLVMSLFIVPIVYVWLAPNELSAPTRIGDEDITGYYDGSLSLR